MTHERHGTCRICYCGVHEYPDGTVAHPTLPSGAPHEPQPRWTCCDDHAGHTVTTQIDHLVSEHGCHAGAFRTSNFPGYVDMNTIRRVARDALRTRANGWADSSCADCEAFAKGEDR